MFAAASETKHTAYSPTYFVTTLVNGRTTARNDGVSRLATGTTARWVVADADTDVNVASAWRGGTPVPVATFATEFEVVTSFAAPPQNLVNVEVTYADGTIEVLYGGAFVNATGPVA